MRIPGLPPPSFSSLGPDGLPRQVSDLPYLYSTGAFPMGDSRDSSGRVAWYAPRMRAVFPGSRLRRSRSLRRALRRQRFRITFDEAFDLTVSRCADRPSTWITAPLRRAYRELHELGVAHSAEAWLEARLVGGVFGIALGRVFTGESMFAHAPDASKVALAHLAARLAHGGFSVFDAQVESPHLRSLGAVTVPQADFVRFLHQEATRCATFGPLPDASPQEVLHWSTHTS